MNQEELELQSDEKGLDIRKVIMKALGLWPWMLLCMFICIAIASIYLYFAQPTYKVNASILIKDQSNNLGGAAGAAPEMNMLQSIGLLTGASSVDNELQIVKSYTLMYEVVKKMQLNVGYKIKSGLKDVPVYGEDLPFVVTAIRTNEDTLEVTGPMEYTVSPGKGGTINIEDANSNTWKGKWGDTLSLPAGKVMLHLLPGKSNKDIEANYIIRIVNMDMMTADLMDKLDAEIPNKQASVIALTLESGLPKKGEDILNELISVYLQANIDDNNRIADSTQTFIDERLMTIGVELESIEKDIQNFKQRNELADITEQAKALIESTGEYEKNLNTQEIQLKILEDIENLLKENVNNPDLLMPATLAPNNSGIAALIVEYNSLMSQRARLAISATEKNPMLLSLDKQLRDIKANLNRNVSLEIRNMRLGVNELKNTSGSLESKIREVPAKEREYLEYSRQQAIKQQLYLFLLQKREEAAISKSSTIANARIIDAAKAEVKPFKPKKVMILAASLLFGVLIPFGSVYAREILNTRIASKEDIESRTSIPILGEIGHNEDHGGIVVAKGSRGPISEQFRMLRTNLQFLFTHEKEKVVLITSSMPSEGKSFVSTNLAAILALSGKKVALLELDLRKPRLSQSLGITGNPGFSAFAIGQASLQEILVPVKECPGLFILPSGPIPPNPAELLLLDRTRIMFDELRKEFDYIVVDTTPNLVTDAQLLGTYADATLYLVRVGVTHKDQLKLPGNLSYEKKLPKVNLVVNDVNYKKYGGYYGYSGYGYGYGYYASVEDKGDSTPKRFWKSKK